MKLCHGAPLCLGVNSGVPQGFGVKVDVKNTFYMSLLQSVFRDEQTVSQQLLFSHKKLFTKDF